jgi:DeoR family transcriptional regulator, glycerol-3-phosphate regulon repressor
MKPKQRQSQIAAIIGRDGQVSVDALAARFDVSTETIRRDLGQLAEAGVVQKVYGGAKRPRLQSESSFQQRMTENAEGKRAIAGKLLGVVERGDTLFIDTGSTTLACAEELAPTGGMTVITNSLRIAQVFGAAGLENAVYLLGGNYSSDNAETVGPLAIKQVEAFQADYAVLTVAAIDARAGIMDANFDEAQMARAMIGRARNVVVVADATKFDRRAAFQVCALSDLDLLISDSPPDAMLTASLREAEVTIR